MPPSPEELASFCNGCDRLRDEGTCKLDPLLSVRKPPEVAFSQFQVLPRQLQYFNRNFCAWAMQNGQSGEMTKEGFTPRQ